MSSLSQNTKDKFYQLTWVLEMQIENRKFSDFSLEISTLWDPNCQLRKQSRPT